MGLRRLFKTSDKVEKQGVYLEYDDKTRIKIARAGGSNTTFTKLFEKKMRPFRRALNTGLLGNKQAAALLHDIYAETIILSWEEKRGGEWMKGIDPEDAGMEGAELLEPTKENMIKVFKELPELFVDIQQQSQAVALFREELDEGDVGN